MKGRARPSQGSFATVIPVSVFDCFEFENGADTQANQIFFLGLKKLMKNFTNFKNLKLVFVSLNEPIHF